MVNTLINKRLPVICLMGPTASGKTALAYALADAYPCDIISVDSAQIYCGMNIGTAKPSAEELTRYPHQLIDICCPTESYSAARFVKDASEAIQASHNKGRLPLLVGGTMLYFKALQQGLHPLPQADAAVRQELNEKAETQGLAALHHELQQADPEAAARIHENDRQRILRALEVFLVSGKPMTHWLAQQSSHAHTSAFCNIALCPSDRSVLHARIAERFQGMIAAGFEKEVAALVARGDLNETLPAMRAVGYQQMWRYLAGEMDHETMVERGIIATRQLAKRQLTWLRAWEDCDFVDMLDVQISALVQQRVDSFIANAPIENASI